MNFIPHLLGEKGTIFSSLAEEIQSNSKEIEGLEEATTWVIVSLYSLLVFEQNHAKYFLEQSYYKKYSLSFMIEDEDHAEADYSLWNTLLESMDTIQKEKSIPLLSISCLTKKALSYLYSSRALSNSYLISFINHIRKNTILYPSTDLHAIGALYEILSTYTLEYKEGALCVRIKTLGQKNAGRYYTPKQLAGYMAEYAVQQIFIAERDIQEISMLDNSCGTGVLLIEILVKIMELVEKEDELFKKLVQECQVQNIEKKKQVLYIERYIAQNILYGVDINPIAIAIIRYILAVKTFIPYEPCIEYSKHIKVGNAILGTSYEEVLLSTSNNAERKILLEAKEALSLAVEQLDTIEQKKYIEILSALYTKNLIEKIYNISSTNRIGKEAYSLFIEGIFHYELEFPEHFFGSKKGFSCIIGNPPWEKIKFENTLFWEQYQSGYGACLESEKYKIRLQETEKIAENKQLLQELSLLYSTYYKEAYFYSRGVGDDNLFRYFIERVLSKKNNKSILSNNGFMLYIVPTGFITEESSSALRVFCIEEYTIDFFIGFENREKIFQNVDSRYKFGILCISKQEAKHNTIPVSFMQRTLMPLSSYLDTMLYVSKDFLYKMSGNILSIPEVRSIKDIDILGRIYRLLPALSEEYITIRRELDCSTHKDLFYEEESELANIPLYRGAMIWQYNSNYTTPRYYMSSVTVDTLLQSRELYRFFNDIYKYLPQEYRKQYRYLGKTAMVLEYLGVTRAACLQYITPERVHYRFGLRAIARNTDERSIIASLLPQGVVYQNSLFGSVVKRYSIEKDKINCTYTSIYKQLYTIAVYNSLVYDWLLRFLTAINISKVYIHRVPFPQVDEKSLQEEPYRTLILNTLRLQMNNHIGAFTTLADTLGIEERSLSVEEERALQIENDCIVARLYEISAIEMQHIVKKEYFSVLHTKKKEYIVELLDKYK